MVDHHRLREELKRMRELIASDERVRARFDTDGNGVIDGEEWEAVRQLVVARLEREEAERRAARDEEANEIPVVVGSVATRIYEQDLPVAAGVVLPPASLAIRDCPEIIIEERGLSGLLGGLVRRNYALVLPDGREAGEIRQRELEWAQRLTSSSSLAVPDLHFDVVDHLSGESLTFRRSQELLDQHIVMLDASGAQVGYVEESFGVLRPTYRVVSTFQRSFVTVKWQLLRPFSLQILDVVDESVGEIERGFTGLGAFLTGANRMRVVTDPDRFESAFRFGVIAAAVLADLSQERRGRSGSLVDMLTGD